MEQKLPTEYSHTSVFLNDAVEALVHKTSGFYVDGTFGMGGHSSEILKRLDADGKILAIDKDPAAIAIAKNLAKLDSRLNVQNGSFADFEQWLDHRKIDGILLDLGVSSPQLDNSERGFSFMRDGPLDMRMDSNQTQSASTWLATATVEEMCKVFWEYGEERFGRRIANAILVAREHYAINTTKQLANIITSACPKYQRNKHPATRVFQAIRIHINKELADLQKVLTKAVANMNIGARLVVISFHSLEDRIAKRFMRQQAKGTPIPKWLPIADADIASDKTLKIIGKARKPTAIEIKANVRARSAILRVAEKI